MDTDANEPEALSSGEAIALLEAHEFGRLAYTRRTLPAIRPVSYAVRAGGVLIWAGADPGLGRAVRGAVVAFQVDELDRATRSGWSVTVTGTASLVSDEIELARARADGPVPWDPEAMEQLIRIPLTMVAGRRLGARRPDRQRHSFTEAGV